MKNVTITLDARTAQLGRQYAQMHGKSLSSLIRDLLLKLVDNQSYSGDWTEAFFSELDQAGGRSRRGERFLRADLYRY